MTNNTYPLPQAATRSNLKLAASNRQPEYGATKDEYEERVFRCASYFSIVRFGVPGGSECATTASFPKALALAHDNERCLIYCVTLDGQAFCIPKKAYNHFAEIWLSMGR